MKYFTFAMSALALYFCFASSAIADSFNPTTGPTNPTPGLPCVERMPPA